MAGSIVEDVMCPVEGPAPDDSRACLKIGGEGSCERKSLVGVTPRSELEEASDPEPAIDEAVTGDLNCSDALKAWTAEGFVDGPEEDSAAGSLINTGTLGVKSNPVCSKCCKQAR